MTELAWALSPRRLAGRLFGHLDGPLLAITGLLMLLSLAAVHSATYETPGRLFSHAGNLALACIAMWLAAQVPLQAMMRFALPMYAATVLLLVGVALFGDIVNGARRWLDLGIVRFQPSQIMKLAMPLMLAWYFHKYEATLRLRDFMIAAVLLLVPSLLIARQPDLGTAILVFASGFFVIYFAGIGWKVLAGLACAGAAFLPLLWGLMHDYQRRRVLTLLDPTQDPLGAGYHIIQSTIAIGSGGLFGKGWLRGTQTHLEFIPERHTDFILAVFAEEFGLAGCLVLLALYVLLITRGFMIAAGAPTLFSRLLAAAVTLIFFTYAFVNIGMVAGVLPVVGVPLPFVSYGGTALLTLFTAVGILMSIQRHRRLVQT